MCYTKSRKGKEHETMEEMVGIILMIALGGPIMLIDTIVSNYFYNKRLAEEQARKNRLYKRRKNMTARRAREQAEARARAS